jgi:HEAT repeat protein
MTQSYPIVLRLEFLVNEAQKISHGAVEVLVRLGDPLGTTGLIALIDNSESWQVGENFFLFRALGQIGGERAFQRLAQEVEEGNPEAVWPLARTGGTRAVDRLIRRLDDHEPATITDLEALGVTNAVDALAYLDDPRAVEPLIAVLQDTSRPPVAADPFYPAEARRVKMLLRVIRALGKLGDSRAIPEVQKLTADQPREIEDEAEWALRELEPR